MSITPLRFLVIVALFVSGVSLSAEKTAEGLDGRSSVDGKESKTFVIVHGAWGGGWAFREVDRLLRAEGHTVYRPTLTGQGERNHLANEAIDLDLHIQDVVNVILWEDLKDVVLVGHSYGGMVVTGVADRIPERIGCLVYLDALLPENGESLNDLLKWDLSGSEAYLVPQWVTPDTPIPHDVPHPTKTVIQGIKLSNQEAARAIRSVFILTHDSGKTPADDAFFPSAERARSRGWVVWDYEADHNPQWSDPEGLTEWLMRAAKT
ncbi:MAG: alpha/beta fold hydrolase [Opitutales bacterium]|nr:alpha/beta fold hydrolase [Opitutales bacterium]